MVQIKAKRLSQQSQYTTLYSDIAQSQFSSKWIDGFMARHKLSNCRQTTVAQKLSDDLQLLQHEFLSFVLYQRIRHNYSLALIGNMDETPLSFDLPNYTTIDDCGANTISIRTCDHEKSNFTVILDCITNRTKLPPVIIFKLVNILWQIFFVGVMICANPTGWVNENEMLWWIENVWNQQLLTSVNPRSLLVLDSFKEHLVNSVK